MDASAIKIKNDIDFIEDSCKLVSETILHVGKYIRPGVETLELDTIAEDYIRSNSAEPAFKGYGHDENTGPFPYTLCISIDDEVVHGMPGKRIIEEGNIVSIDCGVKKSGYFGDSAFTFAVGAITKDKKNLLDVTLNALNLGISKAVTGNSNYDISKAVQSCVESNNYSCVRDLVGHGIGTSLHQEPSIPNFVPGLLHRSRFQKMKLRKGMALAIEPMVNLGSYMVRIAKDGWTVVTTDGKPSAHYEHTVVVEDKYPIVLTYF